MEVVEDSGSLALRTLIGEVRYGDAVSFAGLSLVPLFTARRAPFDYLLLHPAIETGVATIQEVGGGTVPSLRVVNKGDKPILIVDGEHLIGVKQNRIINTTILVPEKSTLDIPVSCVEQGRWSASRTDARPDSPHLFASARATKAETVTESVRSTGAYAADQREIWEHVTLMLSHHNVRSSTMEMKAVYEQRSTDVEGYRKQLPWQTDQTGVVAAVGGRIACCDLFDRPGTLQGLWDRLIASYAVEAIGQKDGQITAETAKAFLWEGSQASITEHPAPGRGADLRLTSSALVGAALEIDQTILHLALFRREPGLSRRDLFGRPSRRRMSGDVIID